MTRFSWIGSVMLWLACGAFVHAQSPPPLSAQYLFPFWSDGDVDSGDKAFHIGYRTGVVITNPNAEPLSVDLRFFNEEGRDLPVTLSDGLATTRVIGRWATVNITTEAAWGSRQRLGYFSASADAKFLMTAQVELVHIQNPTIQTLVPVLDTRVSVMRIEAAKSVPEVLVSWERSATTDTGFVIANTTGQVLRIAVNSFSGSRQTQTVKDLFLGPNSTVIRTISDFDSFPGLLSPDVTRNNGYVRFEGSNGFLVIGVVFRTVYDSILLPAAIATP